MGSCVLLPLALWKQLCVLNTGITWYFKSLYAHPSKMVLEDYREFHDFIVKSIPRFMPFGQRNLNLIEKMDLMRIDIFCADVGESFFFSFFSLIIWKKETGTLYLKMNWALQEIRQVSRNFQRFVTSQRYFWISELWHNHFLSLWNFGI